jgi:hypothetical protein
MILLVFVVIFIPLAVLGFSAGWFIRGSLNAQELDRQLSENFQEGYQAAVDEGWTDLFAKREELNEALRENAQLHIAIGKARTLYGG